MVPWPAQPIAPSRPTTPHPRGCSQPSHPPPHSSRGGRAAMHGTVATVASCALAARTSQAGKCPTVPVCPVPSIAAVLCSSSARTLGARCCAHACSHRLPSYVHRAACGTDWWSSYPCRQSEPAAGGVRGGGESLGEVRVRGGRVRLLGTSFEHSDGTSH